MRYKRYKPNASKQSQNPKYADKKPSSVRRRAVVAGMTVVLLFFLTRIGFVGTDSVNRILDFTSSGKSRIFENEGVKGFLDKLGNLTSEFCFGYLRSDKTGKRAYAVDTTSNSEQEVPSDATVAVPEISVSSDVQILSDADNKSDTEPEKFEPMVPCDGNISSPFGQRVHPLTGAVANHNGIDVACPVGTSVCSVFDGTVEKAEYNAYSGNHIVVRHINGFTSSYAHLSKIFVSVGQSVYKGMEIGKSGSTGMVTGPHLHYEIRLNGVAVNPDDYIVRD